MIWYIGLVTLVWMAVRGFWALWQVISCAAFITIAIWKPWGVWRFRWREKPAWSLSALVAVPAEAFWDALTVDHGTTCSYKGWVWQVPRALAPWTWLSIRRYRDDSKKAHDEF